MGPARQSDTLMEDKNFSDKRLEKFNWGAFVLGPVWTFGNDMGEWKIMSLIPLLNIVAAIHLGLNGNKLAFERSKIKSVDDFMFIQNQWNFWGISAISLAIVGLIVMFLFVK